jgi:hypothetical protein
LVADTGKGLRDLVWHPSKLILAVVCSSGSILLWAPVQKENWSAFAPDFRELQFNEVTLTNTNTSYCSQLWWIKGGCGG